MSQSGRTGLLEFVYLPSYERAAKGLLGEPDERWIEETLIDDPRAGATVADTGGVRKLRVPLAGRGKSGGARVIYFFRGSRGRVYLIDVYAKNRRESLSKADKREIRKLVGILEGERR